jgi:hypothetical protein
MEELNLELNHTYLLRYGSGYTISSATVLMITDKAYRLRWNNGMNSTDTWELKSYMGSFYSIIEDVSDFVVEKTQTILEVKTKLVQCYHCGGLGYVPDISSTAGNKTCPSCFGSKVIPEVTEITEK